MTFAPGDVSETVGVPINGDVEPEPHQDFFVVLSEPASGVISDGDGRGLILNDDGDCTYDPTTKTVRLDVDPDQRALYVSEGWIHTDKASCGVASVTNTDAISVIGHSGDDALVIELDGERFAPGATAEAASSEIELSVDLGGGSNTLTISGSSDADAIVAGAGGINLNPGEETASPDADVSVGSPLASLQLFGNDGDDAISAAGGAGTGLAFAGSATLSGHGGDDELTGGSGPDRLNGGEDDDTLVGGAGIDTADYSGTEEALDIDLGSGTATGAGVDELTTIENLTGGDSDDVISGDSGSERHRGRPRPATRSTTGLLRQESS